MSLTIPKQSEITGLSPLTSWIINTYHRAYNIVGESDNIAHVFYTAMSRHLPRPYRRHILPQGEWGMGKSTLLKTVLKPFWHDVKLYTRMTGPGLDRSTETLDGKILFLEQILQSEPMQLSFLMSEGELAILTVERDPETKRMVSKETRLKGMPVVASTLTGAQVEAQLLSRISTLRIDESDKQTGLIIDKKLEVWGHRQNGDNEKLASRLTWIDRKCKDFGSYVREVKAPWANKLKAGSDIPAIASMRRGLDKIANLVNTIAFVKSALGLRSVIRVQVTQGVIDFYIIAMPEDVQDALYILGKERILESANNFFGKSKAVYDTLPSEGQGWTSRQVAKDLGISQTRAREYLNTLVDLNHATREKDKSTWYYLKIPGSTPEIKLDVKFSEDELQPWFKANFPEPEAQILTPSPEVVIVDGQSKPEMPTIQPIIDVTPTIPRIVDALLENHTVDGNGNGTALEVDNLDAVKAWLRGKGKVSWDYAKEHNPESILRQLVNESWLTLREDGYYHARE